MARPTKAVSAVPVVAITIKTALNRLSRLSDQIPELKQQGRNSTLHTTWRQDVQGVLAAYYGRESLQFTQFNSIDFFPQVFYRGQPEYKFTKVFEEGLEEARGFLTSRIAELNEELQEFGETPATIQPLGTNKVFVVHGHDQASKETVARFLTKLGLVPVILHEQPDQGRTIIEKFEDHSDVSCAVVILSPDDVATSRKNPTVEEKRARQNVIFELGFFFARLGRNKTFALLQHGVTTPSDIEGVLYTAMDDDSWKYILVRELKAAGMDVDANKIYD
jgi:predicted nucleotide-binding protein